MTMERREFLGASSGACAILALHHAAGPAIAAPRVALRPRLLDLRLNTASSIEEMAEFYAGLMEFPIEARTRDTLVVRAGATRLSFEHVEWDEGRTPPWYHVAFNVPQNQIVSVRDWQLERTPFDNNPEAPRHPDHPDIVHFAHWDAHAVFFRDPAGNMLEHIARHTLDYSRPGRFTSRDIACCSEIALVLNDEDVRPGADSIGEAAGVGRYVSSSSRFVALGDENGLVLIMRRGVSMRGRADVYPTEIETRTDAPFEHEVAGFPFRISGR